MYTCANYGPQSPVVDHLLCGFLGTRVRLNRIDISNRNEQRLVFLLLEIEWFDPATGRDTCAQCPSYRKRPDWVRKKETSVGTVRNDRLREEVKETRLVELRNRTISIKYSSLVVHLANDLNKRENIYCNGSHQKGRKENHTNRGRAISVFVQTSFTVWP